jgi:hypothetical protein
LGIFPEFPSHAGRTKRSLNIDGLVKSRNSIEFVWRKPESRVPGENRDPVLEMVPDFRRDDVWTPAFAGVTLQETYYQTFNIILARIEPRSVSEDTYKIVVLA